MKNNISYYRHDTGSHHHRKFKILRRKYGWAGEGKFWALNNMIADSDGCRLNLNDETIKTEVAVELDFDVFEFENFVDYLVNNCRLVVNTDGYLTTQMTQEILENLNEKRNYQREWKSKKSNVESSKSIIENQKSNIDLSKSNVEKQQRKESKVKKRKEREYTRARAQGFLEKNLEKIKTDFYVDIQKFSDRYPPEMLQAFFDYWSTSDKNSKLLRFQADDFWDLEKKLKSWASRETKQSAPPAARNGTVQSIDELKALQAAGKLTLSHVSVDIFTKLHIALSEDHLHQARLYRINQLLGSNVKSDMDLVIDYQAGKDTPKVQKDRDQLEYLAKKIAIIEHVNQNP